MCVLKPFLKIRIQPVYIWLIQQFLFSPKQNHKSVILAIKYIQLPWMSFKNLQKQ